MVIGTKSTYRNPQFEVQWRRELDSVQNRSLVMQHGYENCMAVRQPWAHVALGPDPSLASQPHLPWSAWLCSALLCFGLLCTVPVFLACTALLYCDPARHLWCFSSARETVFILQWKGKVPSSSQRGAHLYRQKSLPLVPDGSVLMQMRTPSAHSCLVQKALFWLARMELLCLVGTEQLQLGGESLSPIHWNRILGTPL